MRYQVPFLTVLLLCVLGACSKQSSGTGSASTAAAPSSVSLVPEPQRSQHYLTVQKHLDLGGTLYGYADVDGDALKMAAAVREFSDQMISAQPQLKTYLDQDYAALAMLLGLTDIKAVGLSSVADGTGYYDNKVFLYTAGQRHGLLAGFGGAPAPFAKLGLAPADTDFYSETEMDLPEVYKTVKAVVVQVAGENQARVMDSRLDEIGQKAAFSLFGLINGWKGRSTVILRLSQTEQLDLPLQGSFKVPSPSLLISMDGIGQVIDKSLASVEALERKTEDDMTFYTLKQALPVKGVEPVIAVKGGCAYLASSKAFLTECLTQKQGLAQNPDFARALSRLGNEGNGLTYLHPRLMKTLGTIDSLNPSLPEEMRRPMRMVLAKLPQVDRPLIALRSNLPEGILIRSHWHRSLKQDIAMISVYNPVTVGMLAAMAIPAFQKVRVASQEKAILNNLRQLSAAADQYYLENGTDKAQFKDLVGPDKYIKSLTPVVGEDYRALRFQQNVPLRIRVQALGKVIQYP